MSNLDSLADSRMPSPGTRMKVCARAVDLEAIGVEEMAHEHVNGELRTKARAGSQGIRYAAGQLQVQGLERESDMVPVLEKFAVQSGRQTH